MTVRFTVAGVTSFRCAFDMCLALAVPMTVRTMSILWTVLPMETSRDSVSHFTHSLLFLLGSH